MPSIVSRLPKPDTPLETAASSAASSVSQTATSSLITVFADGTEMVLGNPAATNNTNSDFSADDIAVITHWDASLKSEYMEATSKKLLPIVDRLQVTNYRVVTLVETAQVLRSELPEFIVANRHDENVNGAHHLFHGYELNTISTVNFVLVGPRIGGKNLDLQLFNFSIRSNTSNF